MKTVRQSFLERADHACLMEAYVGAQLSREGLYVLHTPLFEAMTEEGRRILMYEASDLLVYRKPIDSGVGVPIEVKSSSGGIHLVNNERAHGVLLCSAASYYRKYTVAAGNSTPCIYAFVDGGANVRMLPPGLPITVLPWKDRTRNEDYDVVVALCGRRDFMTVKEVADGIKQDLGR